MDGYIRLIRGGKQMQVYQVQGFHPGELDELVSESSREGFRHIRRLVDEYISGVNRFDRNHEALFVCRSEGRIIGICGLNQTPDSGGDTGRVRRMYVLPEFRRQGVGRMLMQAVIQAAADHYSWLVLRTDQTQAGDFYISLGFSESPQHLNITHCLKLGGQRQDDYSG